MKLYELIKNVHGKQKIKLLDVGNVVFTGYKEGLINSNWLNSQICNIFTGYDDFLVIDVE